MCLLLVLRDCHNTKKNMPTVGVKGLPILATVGYSMYVNVSTVGYSLPILATVCQSMYVAGFLNP